MALPQVKADLTAAKLTTLTAPKGGAWASAARDGGQARVEAMGLPVRRDEYWRYTDPTAWTDGPAGVTTATAAGGVFDAANPVTLVFVDGVFDAAASDALAMEHVSIERLSEVGSADLHWAKGVYGVLEAAGQVPVERPLAALNTAYAAEGVLIHAKGVAPRPIRLAYRSNGGEGLLHHVVKLDPGASVTLLEEGAPGARCNVVTEVEVADGASFDHLRLQGPEADLHTLTHVFARLGQESQFKSFTLNSNGAKTRNEVVVELTGDDAAAHVAGACLGDGEFHHDDTIFVTHDAERCESRQVFKKVLRNGATGVFQGKILVKDGAQKTDGYQISQSLLLDDDSQFLAKPELEIYADDVVCSHGSTSGAINEEGLFYLRSRGIPEGPATNLMVLAFLAEAIDEIADEGLQQVIIEQLETLLATG